ncbi:hypothetical protein [Streptomyces malaysiensis]|uniref:hypothetical protein n=1 Tax=Streptomyces malaysiensis TaxID=92644 RepID=UPI0033ED2F51
MREVGILDPEDPAQARPGELVLAVGARGRAVLPALRAAGAARAAAVAIKLDGPGQAALLGEAAAEAGVALLSGGQETRWEQCTRWSVASWAVVSPWRRASTRRAAICSRWHRPPRY